MEISKEEGLKKIRTLIYTCEAEEGIYCFRQLNAEQDEGLSKVNTLSYQSSDGMTFNILYLGYTLGDIIYGAVLDLSLKRFFGDNKDLLLREIGKDFLESFLTPELRFWDDSLVSKFWEDFGNPDTP